MSEGNPYNGYSWDERMEKFEEMKRRFKSGKLPYPTGRCRLCGDPDAEVEYHDEDYGLPYVWAEPAAYMICHHCHVQRLHARFRNPFHWHAYMAHVRRGGYSSDLKDPVIEAEFKKSVEALKNGQPFELRPLRPYAGKLGQEWFAGLTMDPASLTGPPVRCRP